MTKTVLISMPVEDLQTLIIDCVRVGLKYDKPVASKRQFKNQEKPVIVEKPKTDTTKEAVS